MTEEEILAFFRKKSKPVHREVICGIGDDCAVISRGSFWELLTTDTMVENVHFDFAYFDPYFVGRKLAAVNLSDIAAMGGEPAYALLNLSVPGISERELPLFWEGITTKLANYGAEVIGGDVTRNPERWHLTLTLIGHAPSGGVIFRQGARPGDLIFVSRPLGASAGALELWQKGFEPPESLKRAHLDPEPEIRLGKVLAQENLASAMMDISDGLLLDLARLCRANSLGAEIEAEKIPVHEALNEVSLSQEPIFYALSGGEDFALLFTVPPEKERFLRLKLGSQRLFQIGYIIEEQIIYLIKNGQKEKVSPSGFDHFA
ncbi:thiamine-phosphate kinase [Thermodesulfatator indicus]